MSLKILESVFIRVPKGQPGDDFFIPLVFIEKEPKPIIRKFFNVSCPNKLLFTSAELVQLFKDNYLMFNGPKEDELVKEAGLNQLIKAQQEALTFEEHGYLGNFLMDCHTGAEGTGFDELYSLSSVKELEDNMSSHRYTSVKFSFKGDQYRDMDESLKEPSDHREYVIKSYGKYLNRSVANSWNDFQNAKLFKTENEAINYCLDNPKTVFGCFEVVKVKYVPCSRTYPPRFCLEIAND